MSDYVSKLVYNAVLLRDLPDYPKGTRFKCKKTETNKWMENVSCNEYWCSGTPLADVVDNPEWCKKTVDETNLTEVKCQECGNTKVYLWIEPDGSKYNYRFKETAEDFYHKIVAECGKCSHQFDFGSWHAGHIWGDVTYKRRYSPKYEEVE